MIENKNIFNNEEIKESIQSTNIENPTSGKENNNTQISPIKEEKKPKKRDRRHSIFKLLKKNSPLFEIMKIKEKDKRNYDKIAFEFNKIFKIYKLNKKAEEKKNNSLSSKSLNKKIREIDEIKNKKNKNINLYEVISRLQIPTEIRTMKDIVLIRKYLKTTQVGRLFQNEIKPKSDLYNKLLVFLAFQMKFKKIAKNEILFKIGNRTDFFYLIMEGKVDILKPMSKIHTISGYEYFLQLMKYRRNNDKYLYSLCLKENLRNFEIKTKDGELIPYIFLTYKLDEIKNRYFVDFKAVLDLINVTPEELELEPDKIDSNRYIFNKIKYIKLRIPIITPHQLNIYKFLDDKVNKKEVILFQYEPFLTIGKNSYFGEASFSGRGVRNGTAKIVEDCFFGYLDIQLYNLNFYEEKKAIFEKKVDFLYKNFFFGKISIKKFENQFFNWFISEEYDNNAVIYKENSNCNFIYFIEEGTIELASSRTILEIQILLKKLEEKRLSMKEKGENLGYNSLSNDWFDLEDHVNKNQKNKILILGKNNLFGLESFYYQIPYLTSARVISPKAKVIKIDSEHLYQILIRSSECIHELESVVHNKIDILTNRFFSLNNVKLVLIDNRITFDDQIKYEKHLIELNKVNKVRKNSPFPEKNIEILKKIDKFDIKRENKILTTIGKSGSSNNLSTVWTGTSDKIKEKKEKKKHICDFSAFLPDIEEQLNKNKRKNMNSDEIKKVNKYSYDMKNFASNNLEDNMLKRVKNELKSLKENKYFLTKINTEESEKKEENEEDLFEKERELFMKKYDDKKVNSLNLTNNNSINESKNKDNIPIVGKSELFTFITNVEDIKKNIDSSSNEKKNNINNNKLNENINVIDSNKNKNQITTFLPSIKKPFNKCFSIVSRNKIQRSISIDPSKSKNNLNTNLRYGNHLIKGYSFIDKINKGNETKSQQDLRIFDPKEKYNIFNENHSDKRKFYLNKLKLNKLKGLNEFGFPLKASNSFIPRSIIKNDLNIKLKNYQEYKKKLQRKFEELN